MPLLVEALLLLAFGLLGDDFNDHGFSAHRVLDRGLAGLCHGPVQNAMITKVSNAEIRTTHVTGMVTDIGIEIGKLLYWNRSSPYPDAPQVQVQLDSPGIALPSWVGHFPSGP